MPDRVAVVDIGSNTLLLLVAERDPTARGGVRAVVDRCEFGRLGAGLDATGRLSDASVATSLAICARFRGLLDDVGVATPVVLATEAVRAAGNGAAFATAAAEQLGAPVEIIAGEREARLAHQAVAGTFPELAGEAYLVVDVGGGSTELVACEAGRVVSAVSVPIGAVRLTERHLRGDPPSAAERDALRADVAARLDALTLPRGLPVIATAGTATTLAAIDLGMSTYDADRVTGHRLSPAAVAALVERIAGATVAARRAMPGMVAARADVVAGGALIYPPLLARVEAPHWTACDRGLRWGVVYERLGRQ